MTPAAQEGHQDGDQDRAHGERGGERRRPQHGQPAPPTRLVLGEGGGTGDRFASVLDPFVQRWTVMTRVEDVSPEERDRRMAERAKVTL